MAALPFVPNRAVLHCTYAARRAQKYRVGRSQGGKLYIQGLVVGKKIPVHQEGKLLWSGTAPSCKIALMWKRLVIESLVPSISLSGKGSCVCDNHWYDSSSFGDGNKPSKDLFRYQKQAEEGIKGSILYYYLLFPPCSKKQCYLV